MSVFGGPHEDTPSLHSESGSDEGPTSSRRDKIVEQPEDHNDSDFESDLDSDEELDEPTRKKTEKETKAYRRYHIQESHLIDAFETARSGDLGRNLLGFASERHLNLSKYPAKSITPWTSRSRWTDDRKARAALPSQYWTAWPLPPDDVPSSNERFNGTRDDNSYHLQAKRRRLNKPSEEFEEALCDFAIQKAREKLARAPGSESSTHTASEEEKEEEESSSTKEESETDSEYELKKPNTTETTLPDDDGSVLSFSADQDRSRDILRPTIRSVMSKFDTLMTALYHSRLNHRAHISSSQDGNSQSSRPKSSSSSEGERKEALGLRDWSEVLGMASLTGWDPKIVGRAAQRCSKIFGEGMAFASFDAESTSTKRFDYKPDMIPDLEEEEEWSLDTLLCPHEDCSRHTRGFDLRRRLRWHIKTVHDWDPEVEKQPPKTFGGVHLDGFMREIPAQPGWRSKDKSKSEKRGAKRKKGGSHDLGGRPEESIEIED